MYDECMGSRSGDLDHRVQEIDYYAKKCSNEYGRGIHLMRAITSGFNDIDYRLYDMACEEEIEVEQRRVLNTSNDYSNNLHIIPNPNSGEFSISYNGEKVISFIQVIDTRGRLILQNDIKGNEPLMSLNLTQSGLYFLKTHFVNGTTRIDKVVVNK